MKRVVTSGRTVEDAITSALVQLRITKSQATIRVLQEPVKGLFGLFGGKEAQVEVSVQLTPEEAGSAFLTELCRHMGVPVTVQSRSSASDEVVLNIVSEEEDLPTLIGRHGATLDALQYLVNVAANQNRVGFVKFDVDAGNYRERRREGLHRMAERAAARALRTGRSVLLEPMSSSDRKVIHTYLQEREDVSTVSEGSEPHRKVMVVPGTVARVRSVRRS